MSWRPTTPFGTGGGLTGPASDRVPGVPATGGDTPQPPRRRRRQAVIAAIVVIALGAGVGTYLVTRSESSAPKAQAAAAPTTTTMPGASAVYQKILPSLVVIRATIGRSSDLGTGVVVNRDGTVLTAYHVVRGATAIQLTFGDGTTSAATVSSSTPESDLATLAPSKLPSVVVPAVLAGGAAVGDTTYTAGNPLGLIASFSAGVISGLDRTIPRPDGSGNMTGVIQFDAVVEPGSSGGPLLNRQGQVIGIVTGLANPTDQKVFIGVGFAVPLGAGGGGGNAPRG